MAAPLINEVARDYVTDGVPSSGAHKIRKPDLRSWGTWLEQVATAIGSNPGLIFPSKTIMDAALNYSQGQMAWVLGDTVAANNGIYRKIGTSGTGSWARLGDLPYGLINASDVGAGTPNAIQATSSLPISGSSLVLLSVFESNTGSPVTVSFNGDAPLTIKSNSGSDIDAETLLSGMLLLGRVDGSNFRLISDHASASYLARAEEAADRAEAAEDVVEGLISGITPAFVSIAALEAYTPGVEPTYLQTVGYYAAGDGGGAIYANPVTTDPGKTDAVEISVGSPPIQYWLRRVHEGGGVDVVKHGCYGDGREETARFIDAIALAADLGTKKVVSPAGRAYKLVEGAITTDVDIDLAGSTLLGDYGSAYANKTANMLRTLSADNVSIALRHVKVDGQNLGSAPSGNNGVPMLWFDGGALLEFDRVELLNGANRDSTVHTELLDYTNAECLIRGVETIRIRDSKFWSSPGEILQIQTLTNAPKGRLEMDNCVFSKTRSYNPTLNYSSSSLNLFNLDPTSYARGLLFKDHVKSAMNALVSGMTVENVGIDSVSDSSGIDFNEASGAGFDNIIVRNVWGRNVSAALVRASANNLHVENVRADNCLYGVRVEGDTSGGTVGGSWIIKSARELTGILLRNINGVGGAAVGTDSLISIVGASSTLPAHVTVEAGDSRYSASPSSPIDYGINTDNCVLTMRGGGHREGRSALVRMTGSAKFVAESTVFDTSTTGTNATHLLLMDNATISDIVFKDSRNVGALNAGASDIRFVTSTMTGRISLERSPTISTISDATKPVLRDGLLRGSVGYNPPPIGAGASVSTTVTVTGAAIGDIADATFSLAMGGVIIDNALVTAADTVTVVFRNPTAGSVDVTSGTLYAFVKPRA